MALSAVGWGRQCLNGVCIESQGMGARSPPLAVSYGEKICLPGSVQGAAELGTQPCSLLTGSQKMLDLLWGVSVCKCLC